jgi:hypothetical protein
MPRQGVRPGAAFQTPLSMIIVSESSAEATQLVRTGQYTPARRRSSVARNDTPSHEDASPISVHTEEPTDLRSTDCLRRVLAQGWPKAEPERGGHQLRGYPVASAPDPLRGKLADVTGYPFRPSYPAAEDHMIVSTLYLPETTVNVGVE